MKIIDEKGKIFKLINIVDLLVLIAIVLVILGGIYALANTDVAATITSETKLYQATVYCPNTTGNVLGNLKENDKILYGSVYVNGYVLNATEEPAKIEIVTQDDEITFADHPTNKDLYVNIIIEVDAKDQYILLGKYQINVGKSFVVKTNRVEVSGTVIDIEEYTAK